jgi:hypothetical protein
MGQFRRFYDLHGNSRTSDLRTTPDFQREKETGKVGILSLSSSFDPQ